MEEPEVRKGKERLRFPGVWANATVLKVKSIALQVFYGFLAFFICMCVCLHNWLISEFRTFNVKKKIGVLF